MELLIVISFLAIVGLLITACVLLRKIFLELEWIRLSDPVGKEVFEEAISLIRQDILDAKKVSEKNN